MGAVDPAVPDHAVVLSYYLLDCLSAERRDRSILFWKSLPVSDGLTVASKLLTAFVVVPLGVFLLAMVTYFVFALIIAVRVAIGTAPICSCSMRSPGCSSRSSCSAS